MGPRAELQSLADIRVRVGDRWWSADAEGRFEIELQARGSIRLAIDPAAVEAESIDAPMGCFSAPLEVFAEEGQTQEVALSIFCPAPC